METLTQYQEAENDFKSTNMRVNVTFDVVVGNNTNNGSAAFAKEFEGLLKGNHETLLKHLLNKNYKVKVQARRNRKPKSKPT